MTLKQQIIAEITKVLFQLGINDITPSLDYPSDASQGDYATNVAFTVAKVLKRSPMEVAEEIAEKLRVANGKWKLEVAKPGFINFLVSENILLEKTKDSRLPQIEKGRKVIVEYSSPNIAKPFTIGHLRSTIIGDAIANLLQATGWEVHRDNHIGDWGTQFGKQIYAIKTWGNEEEIEQSDRPVKVLVDLYIKFHQEAEKNPELEDKGREWFRKLEDGDVEARRIWQKCIDWSWKEFNAIYEELGVSFTENGGRGYGESFFEDKMQPVIDELQEKNLLQPGEEGAKIVSFQEKTKLPPLMIVKKDGATLYATRDLATDKFRKERYGDDVMIINEVGSEQTLYFRQLYKLEAMLGWFREEQRIHIKHGMYRFKDQKMSTRKGNVIWLEDVLSMAIHNAHEIAMKVGVQEIPEKQSKIKEIHLIGQSNRRDVTKKVAIGAIKWSDLKRSSEQDIIFDWDDILNMQGNSGPYMQYTFARTQSVLNRGKGLENTEYDFTLDALPLTLASEERLLLVLLTRFPEIVEEAATRFAANILCTYLFDLAQTFNVFYQKYPILKAEESEQQFRLFLTGKVGEVIKQGLKLLGIQAPQQM